jgi:hypothetical protein
MRNDHIRAKRDDVSGWSDKTARSNTRFLQSVSLPGLTGYGYAFTLTLRDCPPTHADWHKLRDSFSKRLSRAGMLRLHWVTEWQRRGVPHLHGVVYFPDPIAPHWLVDSWLDLAEPYGCASHGQNIKPISDSLGWLQYLAKHAARGARHYQRSAESIPAGWQKTGRMWGKWGQWETADPIRFDLDKSGMFAYRRLIRGYRKSEARSSGNGLSIRSARRMLKCNFRTLSEVRGTAGWIPERLTMAMLGYVASQGHSVEN